jgi:hypothetical protein
MLVVLVEQAAAPQVLGHPVARSLQHRGDLARRQTRELAEHRLVTVPLGPLVGSIEEDRLACIAASKKGLRRDDGSFLHGGEDRPAALRPDPEPWVTGGGLSRSAKGDILMSGLLQGTVDFGLGPLRGEGSDHIYVARFDARGVPIAQRAVEARATSRAKLNADGDVFVAGSFSGTINLGLGPLASAGDEDILIAKIDAAGRTLWNLRFGDAAKQRATAIAPDRDGGLFVTGYVAENGHVDFGTGDVVPRGQCGNYLTKIDRAGHVLWAKLFTGLHYEWGSSIELDAAGNVILLGQARGDVDLGGGVLPGPLDRDDLILAKFDRDGRHVFGKRFTSEGSLSAALHVTSCSEILLLGDASGSLDLGGGRMAPGRFIASFDASGAHAFSRSLGVQHAGVYGIRVGRDRNIVVYGGVSEPADLGCGLMTPRAHDGFVAKLDTRGSCIWQRTFGDQAMQWVDSVMLDENDDILVSGTYWGAVDFGNGVPSAPLTTTPRAFLAKLSR